MEGTLRHAADDPTLRLIETARWDGDACALIDLHLARLQDGAGTLGWRVDPVAIRRAMIGPKGAPARLRLTVGLDGEPRVETAPLPAPIAQWRIQVAAQRLVSDDPWLRIKSTRRAAYDDARRALAPGLDEAIFLNERDEVCDGTITTVFFDMGNGIRTPPLSSGLLPGVLRAEMIAKGTPEEVLHACDLPHARLWVGNALRGLSPAMLA